MKRNPIRKSSHRFPIVITLVFFISFLSFSATSALEYNSGINRYRAEEINSEPQNLRSFLQVSPTVTIYINLPIVEQNAQTTIEPAADDSAAVAEVEPDVGTPTPTQIPVQSGSVNLPIVIGALTIILVILLAWFFIGFLPGRIRD